MPSYKTAQKILQKLELTPQEQSAFVASLAATHQKRGLKRMSPNFKDADSSLYIQPQVRELGTDLFRVIGDWYHYAILLLSETEGCILEPR